MIKIKKIVIKTIPHDEQSYDTLGNWWITDDGTLHVTTSELGDHRMSMACGIHEAIEALLCNLDGVDQDRVTAFDEEYETRRQFMIERTNPEPPRPKEYESLLFGCNCVITEDSEPGEDRHSVYRLQHAFADGIERLLAMELGIVWADYADKVDSLEWRGKGNNDAATSST